MTDEPSRELDLIAASLRADTSDVGAFVESLAVKLEEALPGRVAVYRWRGKLFGPKRVHRIQFDAGDERLELTADGAVVTTSRARMSGGIVLKSEELDIDAWLNALGAALAAEAERNATTRQALERLLMQ